METPQRNTQEDPPEPGNLRFLRRLVTVLTATMIGGVLMIIVLIVMRFQSVPPDLPQSLTLPNGARAVSFTQGPDWYAVVTDRNEILIFDRITGGLKQRVVVD